MTLHLYAHPFSSYCQKVLIALYENETPFEFRMLDPEHPENMETLLLHWPIGKFPLLLDNEKPLFEATIIIEHLMRNHPGKAEMLPGDNTKAAEVRLLDRIFDNYVMNSTQAIVGDALRPDGAKDPTGVSNARAMLDKVYGWLDKQISGRLWAAGTAFTLADCAAAPSLFYADWVHPIGKENMALRNYRSRLLAHPSVKRAVDEARPYRDLFPLGAPDRD